MEAERAGKGGSISKQTEINNLIWDKTWGKTGNPDLKRRNRNKLKKRGKTDYHLPGGGQEAAATDISGRNESLKRKEAGPIS
jgi:hypothetical protein